ncbi:MAG: ATP synthase F1 subunit delta [Candidatus Marinimicrobia bacterium]|jgi:F-type H+-transporting ATPase subunit delta|nr:ATP synthase F1 subunit delta [Candidatus Neomarinimicrobiota bacterium]MBT3500865.1 ATP synthase F1 subunit delta [Candidatus Neomarinimicrobiota bacterium]MBT3838899.1 ATP synthase F1 subunit delta [Candidatus Neomarinimicrobiota bacterium]MBT4000324.1 ATP synthase F1 subunit delta [Candidatus Neomarinimicrobiota bacterium]MBT4282805.1 ATP synthase F1 subunit delta [Candidatus Neomarinimicrobiota bacterium]
MTHKHNAKRLAKAIYSVSDENNLLESVHGALNAMNDLVKTESEFRAFIQSKRIKSDQKISILNQVMGEKGHPLVSDLLFYLKGNKAPRILLDLTKLFNRYYKEGKNILSVFGTVANEMSDEEKKSLKISLDTILGKETDLYIDVDESLIGGIKLRIENTFLDASVQNQLQVLKGELLQL